MCTHLCAPFVSRTCLREQHQAQTSGAVYPGVSQFVRVYTVDTSAYPWEIYNCSSSPFALRFLLCHIHIAIARSKGSIFGIFSLLVEVDAAYHPSSSRVFFVGIFFSSGASFVRIPATFLRSSAVVYFCSKPPPPRNNRLTRILTIIYHLHPVELSLFIRLPRPRFVFS